MSDLFSTKASVAPRLEISDVPRDHRITLDAGIALVQRYRDANPEAIHSSMYDRVIFDAILAQPECAGVRMYYAQQEDGMPTLVLVGVDAQGNDLADGIVADDHWPCPPFCPTLESPLNVHARR